MLHTSPVPAEVGTEHSGIRLMYQTVSLTHREERAGGAGGAGSGGGGEAERRMRRAQP